ncbi:hypothetical protein INT47_006431 [Mucor saturninus]|uniref:Protein kinase domain-containing protein n=1 Tax=Mucor saturninus TaxID=64648 RepID=A0A8H7UNZ4_9FUNG|nr:hypothetical protein INT47_006431 [Mucor saturninus]
MSSHPNIVQLYETFLSPSTKEFYFIMEYMDGGNLYQFINDHKEANQIIQPKEIKSILFQILSALNHIHHVESIFHRDMKPENLLITQNLVVKLADFGLATDIKKITRPCTDYVSTRWYRAPEVLLKSSNYSYPIDLWAVGAIFAELVTLNPLFPGQSEIDQLFRICKVLGTPSTTAKKTYSILQPNFINSKSNTNPLTPVTSYIGIGGEWKDGVKLAHKMGFEFPKIFPKIDSLSMVLQPNSISSEGIDLLSKLLQFDPCKRITSSNALSHPFFMPSLAINTTPVSFDLPTIPLSPFQLLEEEYSQWDLLTQPSLTRTTSFPNILLESSYEDPSIKRSISDLSIPNLPQPPSAIKKTTHRLSLWAKKHIIV